MRLTLLRHGQTTANAVGALDTGAPGADLTALGVRQAEAVPEGLARVLDGARVDGVVASPLVRTQQTAAPLGRALGRSVPVVAGLEEISAGDVEMRTDHDAHRVYIDTVAAWLGGDLGRVMPGAGHGEAFLARYDAAVAQALAALADEGRGLGADDDTHLVVVSHGAAIRTWTTLRADLGAVDPAELRIMNTGAALLVGSPADGWRLETWHTDPVGGAHLLPPPDDVEEDVTGDAPDDARA